MDWPPTRYWVHVLSVRVWQCTRHESANTPVEFDCRAGCNCSRNSYIHRCSVKINFEIHTNLFYVSEVVKELHLVFGTVWRETIESQKTIQLSRVIQRVGNKHWCLDEGEHVLRGFCIQHDIIQIKRSIL